MTILIATDSFKDALSAEAVCRAIASGLQLAAPEVEAIPFPLADGGEGTAEILTLHSGGRLIDCAVQDPLGRLVKARYGLSADGRTAFIDMAQASGLPLLAHQERQPLRTTTFGTGELILDAIRRGADHILLGIGGSATNDAGMGMATALGYRFYDNSNQLLAGNGRNLQQVARIEDSNLFFDPKKVQVEVLCDVDNPLFGPRGAACVYAPQKGASPEEVEQLDQGLQQFAVVLNKHFSKDFSSVPGAGAAGGLGAGAMAFLGAQLRPGIETVIAQTGFEHQLQRANLVITGEGKLDGQTLHGKLIYGICRYAQKHGVPVIAMCGALDASPQQLIEAGLTAAFSITSKPQSLEKAIENTARNLEQTAFNILRVIVNGP